MVNYCWFQSEIEITRMVNGTVEINDTFSSEPFRLSVRCDVCSAARCSHSEIEFNTEFFRTKREST